MCGWVWPTVHLFIPRNTSTLHSAVRGHRCCPRLRYWFNQADGEPLPRPWLMEDARIWWSTQPVLLGQVFVLPTVTMDQCYHACRVLTGDGSLRQEGWCSQGKSRFQSRLIFLTISLRVEKQENELTFFFFCLKGLRINYHEEEALSSNIPLQIPLGKGGKFISSMNSWFRLTLAFPKLRLWLD